LLIVFGSSLTVFPFAAIPSLIPSRVSRFIISKHISGSHRNAWVINGGCDQVVSELVRLLSTS
jgi:NAD-dependent SIR2 family protein deacetylase